MAAKDVNLIPPFFHSGLIRPDNARLTTSQQELAWSAREGYVNEFIGGPTKCERVETLTLIKSDRVSDQFTNLIELNGTTLTCDLLSDANSRLMYKRYLHTTLRV